jgi:nucleoid-associated protein YgaU
MHERTHMSLRDKYAAAIHVAKSVQMQGAAEDRDGKLHFKGVVKSDEERNRIWDALKSVPDWQQDLVVQIDVAPGAGSQAQAQAPAAAPAEPTAQTYTVQPGDTLSAIAKKHLGSANAYMAIFNANRDQLSDPDKIKPGQVLTIPARA